MSIAEVKENVINLMNTLARRSDAIERMNGSKSLLEIDLVMEDIRTLYREMDRLRKFMEVENMSGSTLSRERVAATSRPPDPATANSDSGFPSQIYPRDEKPVEQIVSEKPVAKAPEIPSEKKQEEKPVEEVKTVVHSRPVNPTPFVEQQVSQKESVPQPLKNHQETPASSIHMDTPLPVRNESIPPVRNAEAKEVKKTLVGERFSTDKGSLHERLAQIRDDKSIGMRMQSKPVANIKDAIGLNEKFLFINELFGGDISAYNNALSDLNARSSIHDAFEMLNNLTEEFKWDGQRSAETIEKFANLVQRRYME